MQITFIWPLLYQLVQNRDYRDSDTVSYKHISIFKIENTVRKNTEILKSTVYTLLYILEAKSIMTTALNLNACCDLLLYRNK